MERRGFAVLNFKRGEEKGWIIFHPFYFKMKIDIFDFENNKRIKLTMPKTDCEYVIRNNTYIVFTKKIEVVQLLLKHLKNFNIKLIPNSKEYVIKFKRNKNILVV